MGTNDFVVKSMSHCFLCLNQISPPNEHSPYVNSEDGPGLQSSATKSLQNLSDYLKMDLSKVFNENELIPQHLLDKVKKSKLKGELCDECALLNDKLSEQYLKLAKIKMEMLFSVRIIQDKLLAAEETNKSEALRKLANSMTDPADGWTGKLDILEVLRLEAIQKCTQKISSDSPRPKVKKLTMQQVNNKRQKFTVNSKVQTGIIVNPELELKNVMMDFSDQHVGDNDNYYNSDNSDIQDSYGSIVNEGKKDKGRVTGYFYVDHPKVYDANAKISTRNDPNAQSSSMHAILPDKLPQINLNLETGKYKCSLCIREFKTKLGVCLHHKSVHLGIKYKCSICGREFTQSSAFNLHHRTIHLGVGFKCLGCNKKFGQKKNLLGHQRNGACKPALTNCKTETD